MLMLSKGMNKKGHVPTILLFIIALVLILTAWFTFFTIKSDIGERANEIAKLVGDLEFDERYVFAVFERSIDKAIDKADKDNFKQSFEDNFVDIVGKVGGISSVSNTDSNFFEKISKKEYVLTPEDDEYTLIIEDVFISSHVGKNEIKRPLSLSVRFDKNGIIK